MKIVKRLLLGAAILLGCADSKPSPVLELEAKNFQCPDSLVGRTELRRLFEDPALADFSPLIPFKSARHEIPTDAHPALDSIAEFLKSNTSTYFVSVHSDRNGPEGAVLTLSRNRAKAIAAYLTTKGVARERVIAVGAGWKCYIGDSTPEFQMRNRRVEFIRKRD